MVLNKLGFSICMLCFLCLATISMGFDLYAHGVLFYFFEYTLNPSDLLFDKVVLPRYLLLSYIYEITRRLGIPLGIVVLFLVCFPCYTVSKKFTNKKNYKINTIEAFILIVMINLCLFYSGLSLVLLWLIALLITKKKIFLIGGLFHPVGIVLSFILVIFNRKYLTQFFINLILFLFILYLLSKWGYFSSSQSPYIFRNEISLDKDNLLKLLTRSLESKFREIGGLLFIGLTSFLAKSKLANMINKIRKIYINNILVIFFQIIIIIGTNFYFIFNARHNLIMDILEFEISDPIYATWFDWGKRDLKDSPRSLYNKRYDNSAYYLD